VAAASSFQPNGRKKRLLIASTDHDLWSRVSRQMDPHCWEIVKARSGAEVLHLLESEECQALLLDRWLPDLDAEEVSGIVRRKRPGVEVAFRESAEEERLLRPPGSAAGSTEQAVQCQPTGVVSGGAAAVGQHAVNRDAEPEALPGMVGSSEALSRVYRLARLVAPRDTAVLLTGETGTGKELVARAIHQLSPRAPRPFAVVNCAAIPEPLLEAELFGHTRGAFTGALQSRPGRIHSAHGGTLFLDEADEFPTGLQAKILRFLQDGEVQRLGSPDVFRVDVRVIAATNANLKARIAARQFREDLYYRLAVFPIHVPPLRDRSEDIVPLARHTLGSLCRQANVPPKWLPPETCSLLCSHPWPGNVRELQHSIERAFILCGEEQALLPEFFSYLG
jgi:DNA-binding NtrC family response regulator